MATLRRRSGIAFEDGFSLNVYCYGNSAAEGHCRYIWGTTEMVKSVAQKSEVVRQSPDDIKTIQSRSIVHIHLPDG
jgi:hypothetical protein